MPKSSIPFSCLGLLAMLAACEMLSPPAALPPNAQLMTPPAEYVAWWSSTEACSGRSGNLATIEWYYVPDVQAFETETGPKVGLWTRSSAGIRIIIAGAYAHHELVVRHEMLHALLDREGHPAEYFQTKCQLTWDSWPQETPALRLALEH